MPLTTVVFVLGYFSGLGLSLFRHPRYGLYTYLAVFYLDPPTRWWSESLPDLRWSLLAALVTLVSMSRLTATKQSPAWLATTPGRFLLFFTVWMWVQNAWALLGPEHLEASILFTKYLVLFYLVYRLMETPDDVRDLLLVHTLGCGYLGWLGYLAPAAGRLEGVGGPGIDEANALAMFVSTGALCGSVLILSERSWRRWVCILPMPFILNILVQSESRGAMLGVVAGGLVLFYLRPRRYRMSFYAFAVAGALLFGYLAQDFFWARMSTLRAAVDETAELDSSAQSRIELAKAQLRMAASHPFGVGHRGTAALSPRYLDVKWLTYDPRSQTTARSSHNTVLSVLVEHGWPGVIAFALLIVWFARSIQKLKTWTKLENPQFEEKLLLYGAAAAASLAVVFVAGLFTDYIKTEVQIWMYAILSSVVVAHVPAALGHRRAAVPPLACEPDPPRRRQNIRSQA